MSDALVPPTALPVTPQGVRASGWYGLVFLIATEAALFVYLLFSFVATALRFVLPPSLFVPSSRLFRGTPGYPRCRPPCSGGSVSRLSSGVIGCRLRRDAGMLGKARVRASRSFQNDTRLRHGRCNHRRFAGFRGNSLMKQVASGAPSLQRRLH